MNGKPKQIKETTQSYREWVNIKVNAQLITIKTKMISKSNMAEIPMRREIQHCIFTKQQLTFYGSLSD